MKRFEWTETDRVALRELLASDNYETVQKVIGHITEQASYNCGNVPGDHRYFQGVLHGIYNVLNAFEIFSRPGAAKEQEDDTTTRNFSAPVSSSGDY